MERMMNQQLWSRLSTRLGLAMLASVLITIVLILTTVAVFGYARLPKISPVQEFRDLGLEAELSKPSTELSFVIKADGVTRSIPASDDFKKSLIFFFVQQGDGLPIWLLNGLSLGAFASISLALITAYEAAKRIAQPIEAVSRAATQMGQGDLSARAPIDATLNRSSFETLTLAQNFNTMAEALEQAQQQRRDMIADIAHELRTPLGVMNSRLEALEDGVIPFDLPEVQKLQQHTRLLIRLVEDLRVLSLADSGQLEIHPRAFDLATNARIAVGGFEARANTANVRLNLQAPERLPFTGDPDRITQVISNLISNALQHTPAGGEINVRLSQAHDITLEVQDSGPGIPTDHLERIFDRFHRVDASRSRASGGTGLGLAIVRTIIELHGGEVRVRNARDGGSVFSVIFRDSERKPPSPT
jgi:two-component system, OmpR family, sensor histidine kinase BaeS